MSRKILDFEKLSKRRIEAYFHRRNEIKTKPKIVSYQEFKKILLEVGGEKATKAKYEQYKIEIELLAEGKEYIPDEEEGAFNE